MTEGHLFRRDCCCGCFLFSQEMSDLSYRKRSRTGKRKDEIYLDSDFAHPRANFTVTFENLGYAAENTTHESVHHRSGSVTSRQEQVNGVGSLDNNNATQQVTEKTVMSNPTYGVPFTKDPAIIEDSENRYATIEEKKTESQAKEAGVTDKVNYVNLLEKHVGK